MNSSILKKALMLLSACLFIVSSSAEAAETVEMGMVTGGPKGTYYQFGLNLEQLMKPNGIQLNVHNSDGSVENIYAVFKRPNTQLGIVQSDVLAFVAKVQTDPVLKQIAKKIKMVYPLYDEEVHLVGRRDIKEFDGLQGKKVAIGQEGSGSYLTAKLLFEVSGIKPAEIFVISADQALPKVKAGEIDAMFYVAGYPVKLFSEQVSSEDGLALLPIVNTGITEFYAKTTIPGGTYDWQPEAVDSVAVKSVLVSFNFRMARCENVGKFAEIIETNLDWLKQNGHPKWKSVDLDYPLKGWEQYDCVKKQIVKETAPRRGEINPVLEAIKGIL